MLENGMFNEPDREEAEPVETCGQCGAEINSGDDYYEIQGEILCEDCLNENFRHIA